MAVPLERDARSGYAGPRAPDETTVLLVASDPEFVALVAGALSQSTAGMHLLFAYDLREATDALRNETVHVLVADGEAPDALAIDALAKAQRLVPSARRILVAPYRQLSEASPLQDAPAHAVVARRLEAGDLARAVLEQAAVVLDQMRLAVEEVAQEPAAAERARR